VVILVAMRIEYRGCRGVLEDFEDDRRSDCFAWGGGVGLRGRFGGCCDGEGYALYVDPGN
jgi:hypothetical protein